MVDVAATGGADLLFQEQIRDAVRAAYRSIPAGAGRTVTDRFYADSDLDGVPAEAIAWALGVGDPVRHAGLRAGEVVVDLGCGAGIDTILAARAVGPTGRVIGLDTLPEMRRRAEVATAEAGVADRCELLTGEMESIPLPDGTADVVISNGVLNLSPRKSRAIAEMARVLRPGGRICLADLVVDRDLPPEVLASEAAWAGCIAGAVSERVLNRKLARAGFTDIALGHRTTFSLDDVAAYPLFTPEVLSLMRRLIPPDSQRAIATGVIVQATITSRRPAPPTPVGAAPSGVAALDDVSPGEVEAPGVTVRQLKRVDDVSLKVLDVEPGGSTPFHTHPHAHEGVVISGQGALRLRDRSEPLGPGDVFTVNPNAPHAITNRDGTAPLRFVCMDCFID